MEVQLGQLLSQNASDAGVKEFAQKMVTDHGQVNDELKALAARKNITIPTTPGNDAKDDMDKLNKKKGRDLDKAYISLMVDDHKDDVDKFEKASKDCDDPDIKAFAAKHLPHLKMHLQNAQTLHDRLKK
jgi:putative membrane protein